MTDIPARLTAFWAWATFSVIAVADQALPKLAHTALEAEKWTQ